jgi:membrane protease subunit (stomatin/prohibitin family)
MTLRAEDSRKLLLKLVGTESFLTQSQLVMFFRSFLMARVKTYIAQTMKANSINIFEIDENLALFSDAIKALLVNDFAEYGIALEQFFVTTIVKPDGDRQYEQFKELHFRQYADIAEAKLRQQTDLIYAETEAQKLVIDSKAQATKRAQEGYTYSQERGFDVAEKIAENEAVGEFTNMGVGLGTMAGVGGAVGGMVGGMMGDVVNATTNTKCAKCGASLPYNSKFCLQCGEKVAESNLVVCPQCGKSVQKGKFCLECGYKFANSCPKCGTDVPGGNFCPQCGEKL